MLQYHTCLNANGLVHGLRTPGEEIVFTARPKIKSQIFRYSRSIFCLLQNGSQDFNFLNCHGGADYSFYVKPIVTFDLKFHGYIISGLASVHIIERFLFFMNWCNVFGPPFPHNLMTPVFLKYFCKQNFFHKFYILIIAFFQVLM